AGGGLRSRLAEAWRRVMKQLLSHLPGPKIVLLAVLLLAHLLTRVQHTQSVPPHVRRDYLRCYGASLSLMAGQGLANVGLGDGPSSLPFKEFLTGRRDGLTPQEFDTYWQSPW